MKTLLNFFKYNNAVPISLGILFLGGASVFAASDPGALIHSQSQVVSVDNTYIVNKDLSTYTPQVEITSVTEDTDNYYVAYKLSTIELDTYVWKDVFKTDSITVSKADLGPYRDLGVYVTQQLRQIIDRNLAYLREVQAKESKHVSQAVVATAYGGIIGQFLTDKTETLPGYIPVVVAPQEQRGGIIGEPGASVAAAVAAAPPVMVNPGTGSQATATGTPVMLSLQLMGNNPARVAVDAVYTDLGVFVLDSRNTNTGYQILVDGTEVTSVSISTSASGAHTVEYSLDVNGSQLLVRRVVLVGDAADPGGEISYATSIPASPVSAPGPQGEPVSTTTPPAPDQAPSPEPAPQPEPTATSTPPAPAATSTPPAPDPAPSPEPTPQPGPPATSTPPADSSSTATSTP